MTLFTLLVVEAVHAQIPAAQLTYPTNGQSVTAPLTITWNSVPNAQAYYLYVGSTAGAKDVVNTGQTTGTAWYAANLPVGALYTTLFVEMGGQWTNCGQTTFSVTSSTPVALQPQFVYPSDQSTNVDAGQAFSWTAVPNAQGYVLSIGSSPSKSDLFYSGTIAQTSIVVPSLPVGQPLYATIYAQFTGPWWKGTSIGFTCASSSSTNISNFVYPTNLATNVDTANAFQWTPVPNAQAYYLWVGSGPNMNDLVNSGGTQNTSWRVPPLPTGAPLYARISTEISGVWLHQDIQFTVTANSGIAMATLSSPSNRGNLAPGNEAFTWNAVPGATDYALYIGTSAMANNLVSAGGIFATSYTASSLPVGTLLYATLFTHWMGQCVLHTTTQFVVGLAQLTYPQNGATAVNLNEAFTWNAVPGAQNFYLRIGSSPGQADAFNSGGLPPTTTSLFVPSLPSNQTLYATLSTQLNGQWYQTASQFSGASGSNLATLVYPSTNGQSVAPMQPFQWTPIAAAQQYVLMVGTTPGASDVFYGGGTAGTSQTVGALKPNTSLYATVYTELSGIWSHSPSVEFTATAAPMTFLSPTPGSINVDPGATLSWQPPLNASGLTYNLCIGTSPGASDCYSSGSLSSASAQVPSGSLPAGEPLYATVSVVGGNPSQVGYTVFAVSGSVLATPNMTYPTDGQQNVDAGKLFTWTASDLANCYRLQIFSNGSLAADSGVVPQPFYLCGALQPGNYTATLSWEIGGQWSSSSFSFNVATQSTDSATQFQAAQTAAAYVRAMADATNNAYSWTPLFANAKVASQYGIATCYDYAVELLSILASMNLTAQCAQAPQQVNIGFTSIDVHAVVGYWYADLQKTVILDPTFDLYPTNSDTNTPASAQDVQAATLAMNWNAITYKPLAPQSATYAHNYYLDYPLLYLNILSPNTALNSPLPYLQSTTAQSTPGWFILSSSQSPVTGVIDGANRSLITAGPWNLSGVFGALSSISFSQTTGLQLYQPQRYVF